MSHIKDMLVDFENTGVLSGEESDILEAIKLYEDLIECCCHLPHLEIIHRHTCHEHYRLKSIAQARGYKSKV